MESPFPTHRALLSAPDSELGELLLEQVSKVAEELEEVSDCIMATTAATVVNASALMEETLDLIHAAYGVCYVLERLHPGMKTEDYIKYVTEKNRARGYYDA